MAKMGTHKNEEILLTELKAGKATAFEAIYRNYYPMVLKMVSDNSGSSNEAQDVFQEMLLVLVKKIRESDFKLSAKLSTYLFAVARNIWFKRGRGMQGKTSMIDSEQFSRMDLTLPENELEDVIEREQMLDTMSAKMDELEPDCRRILFLSIQQNFSQKEIAEIMDYSVSFVKVKKFRCLKYLREKVKDSDLFDNLRF